MSELGPEARSILDAGKDGDSPAPADRARVRKNLSRMIAAGGVIGAASAAGTAAEGATATVAAKAFSLAVAGKIVGGLAFVVALGAGIWISRPQGPSAPPASTVVQNASLPTARAPSTAAAAPAQASSAEPSAQPGAEPEPEPAHPAIKPSASAKASSSAPAPGDTLEEETTRLREAHSALQSGDPQKALKLLDEQSAAYEGGQLREERAAARVLALCKAGQVDQARAEARTFLRDHPRSPLADRVRGGCPSPASP